MLLPQNNLSIRTIYKGPRVKSESPQTFQVLGLTNITCMYCRQDCFEVHCKYRVSHQLCPNFKFDFGPFPLILQRTCIKYQSWSWTLKNLSHWETGDSLRFNDPRAFLKKSLKTGLLILTKSACHPHHHSPPPPPEQKLEGGPSKIQIFDLFPWFYRKRHEIPKFVLDVACPIVKLGEN